MYFYGIIDMLQLYNVKKMLEHHAKTKLKCVDADGLSAVNPDFYAQRFLDVIKRRIR